MSTVKLPTGVADHEVPRVVGTSRALFRTNSFQISVKSGSGTATVKGKAKGSPAFEDLVDSEGTVIGQLNFDAPKLLRVLNCDLEALQIDTSGLSGEVEIEINDL